MRGTRPEAALLACKRLFGDLDDVVKPQREHFRILKKCVGSGVAKASTYSKPDLILIYFFALHCRYARGFDREAVDSERHAKIWGVAMYEESLGGRKAWRNLLLSTSAAMMFGVGLTM